MTNSTKLGLTADRIAELEREIAELEAANEAAPTWGAAVGARWEQIKGLRAELSRLRNEQPAVTTEFELDEGLHEHAFPSPAPSPEPQDVRGAACRALCKENGTAQCAPICLSHFSTQTTDGKCPEAECVWGRKADFVLAALAQSDAQPVAWRPIETAPKEPRSKYLGWCEFGDLRSPDGEARIITVDYNGFPYAFGCKQTVRWWMPLPESPAARASGEKGGAR